MKKTLVVNLFGGPGTGKTTGMAYIFAKLKMAGVDAEMVTEFAKELTWEKRQITLSDQLYILGKQQKKHNVLSGQVQVVITDSPILLSLYYGKDLTNSFKDVVIETHEKFWNYNVFLKRIKPYNTNGRSQTEDQAKQIDVDLKEILKGHSYVEFDGTKKGYKQVYDRILEILDIVGDEELDERFGSMYPEGTTEEQKREAMESAARSTLEAAKLYKYI